MSAENNNDAAKKDGVEDLIKDMGKELGSIDMEEEEDMELGEDDMEEVTFENDTKPPSDDEDDGEELEDEDQEKVIAEIEEPDTTMAVFTGHSDAVFCVGLNSDGTMAISGGGDDKGYLWNVLTGSKIAALEGHTDSISDCGFSFDSSLVATAGYDSTVRIWNGSSGAFQRSLDGPSSEIEFIAWHPKGNVLMAGSEDATCWIWDAATGNCISVLAGHEAPLTCGSFTPNGKRAVTGSLDGTLRLWDPSNSSCIHTFTGHEWHQAGIVSLKCHYDQPMVAAGGQDGTVRIARLENKRVVAAFNHDVDKGGNNVGATAGGNRMQDEPSCVEALDFCQVAPYLASGGTDGTVKVFDLNTQSCRQVCKHLGTVVKVEFLPQSTLMVSASSDGTSRLWDSRSGESVRLLTKHNDSVLDFSLKNSIVVSCSDDNTCRVSRTA